VENAWKPIPQKAINKWASDIFHINDYFGDLIDYAVGFYY